MTPLVSVVIPSYNHELFVGRAVQSVWDQTYATVELIVVDDGSEDGSVRTLREMASQSPMHMVVEAKNNEGLPATLNRAIALCNGEYLAILASDDEYPSRRLAEHVKHLESTPRIAGCYGDMEIIDSEGVVLTIRSLAPRRGVLRLADYILFRTPLSLQACTLRRAAVASILPFDQALQIEDRDFLIRLLADHELDYIGGIAARYRANPAGMNREVWLYEDEMLRLLDKHKTRIADAGVSLAKARSATLARTAHSYLNIGETGRGLRFAMKALLADPLWADAYYALARSVSRSVRGGLTRGPQ